MDSVYKKNWVTYCKPPFAGASQVLKYLGGYTHRIAISNNRIVAVDEDSVTFLANCKRKVALSRCLEVLGVKENDRGDKNIAVFSVFGMFIKWVQ